MFDRQLTREEVKNFLQNVENYRLNKWMTMSQLARKMEPNNVINSLEALSRNFRAYKNGGHPRIDYVIKIAAALECTPEVLLAEPAKDILSISVRDFIKEAVKKGLPGLNRISTETEISLNRLNEVINQGVGKFNQNEIASLLKMNFKLPTLAPFADYKVDLLEMTKNHFVGLSHEERKWYDQRRAVSFLLDGNNFTKKLLSENTKIPLSELKTKILLEGREFTQSNLARPPEKEWRAVLQALGAKDMTENQLVLMGRYSLNRQQLNELIQCEAIFKKCAIEMGEKEIVANVAEKGLYHFYISLKHEWANLKLGQLTKDVVQRIITEVGSRKFVLFTSAFLTSALKSVPVVAAEIVGERIKVELDKNAAIASEENRTIDNFNNRLTSHLIKFLLLIPKGISGALATSVEVNDPMSFVKLPRNILDNFFKAEGYADSIVNDWKDLLKWTQGISQERINKTINNPNLNVYAFNTHFLSINGVEEIISAMLGPQGLELHQYDPSNNTWIRLANGPAWAYSNGFFKPQYYETLRTHIITINGEQRLIALMRTSGGLDLHEYNPKTNTWKQLNWGPLWSDSVGFASLPCYKSIRTEVMTVNEKQYLFAMVLASGGLLLHQYDPSNNTWIPLANGPAWSHSTGFFEPQYYETIRTNVITINGEQRLIALMRTSGGLDLHEYNPKTNTWKQLNWGPLWSDKVGYACAPCYKSIRTEVMTVDGKQHLFAMVLASGGIQLHQFDPDKNVWNELVSNTAPVFIKSLSDPKYYETISTAVIVVDGKEKLLVMVRAEHGIQFHQYDPSTALWTEHQSHEAHIKNLNIAYGTTLLLIDQKKEQERQAAIAEEQKRQAAVAEAAEQQKLQAAIAAEQQKQQAAMAEAQRRQAAIAQQRIWALCDAAQMRTRAQMNQNMSVCNTLAIQQSLQNLQQQTASLPKPAYNGGLPYPSETFSWYRHSNPYLNPTNSLLTYANNTTGGPGFFSGYNSGMNCAKTFNDVANGMPICIKKPF